MALERFTGFDVAERLTRLLQPLACLCVFLTAMARLGRDLIGSRGVPAATLLAVGSLACRARAARRIRLSPSLAPRSQA